MKLKMFLSLIVGSLMTCSALAAEIKTVNHVDIKLYMGQWYEIAAIPQSFQKQCVKDTQAYYELTDQGSVKVLNSCTDKNGKVDSAEGRAKITDKNTNAKLKVTFVKIFKWAFALGGKYWIVDLAPDYRYALVGHPTLKYAWILSRTPNLSSSDLSYIESKFKSLGYDTCKILTTVQTGGLQKRMPLCKVGSF